MILVADNLHILQPVIQTALQNRDPQPIQKLVKRCEQAGADAIDINAGPLPRDPEDSMVFMVETVQAVTDLPVLIDTANPRGMEAGLQAAKNRAVINGFSLEPHKLERILPLAKKYNSDIIGYLLFPDSRVPDDASERCTLAIQVVQAVEDLGIALDRLIIDPIVVPLTWQNGSRQAAELIDFIHNLPNLLGFHVQTIAGLSNLISGQGHMNNKLLMERTYLPMLASAGLGMVLCNIFHPETVRTARACRPIIRPGIFSWAEL